MGGQNAYTRATTISHRTFAIISIEISIKLYKQCLGTQQAPNMTEVEPGLQNPCKMNSVMIHPFIEPERRDSYVLLLELKRHGVRLSVYSWNGPRANRVFGCPLTE